MLWVILGIVLLFGLRNIIPLVLLAFVKVIVLPAALFLRFIVWLNQ